MRFGRLGFGACAAILVLVACGDDADSGGSPNRATESTEPSDDGGPTPPSSSSSGGPVTPVRTGTQGGSRGSRRGGHGTLDAGAPPATDDGGVANSGDGGIASVADGGVETSSDGGSGPFDDAGAVTSSDGGAPADCVTADVIAGSASPAATNASGQVAGNATVPGGLRAFLWTNGVRVDLPTLGGAYSVALSMNDDGVVVGVASRADEAQPNHGVVWKNGTVTEVGTFGGFGSDASFINAAGHVSGTADHDGEPGGYAYLWDGSLHGVDPLSPHGPNQALGLDDNDDILAYMSSQLVVWSKGKETILGDAGSTNFLAANGTVFSTPGGRAYVWSNGTKTSVVPFADETSVAWRGVSRNGIGVGAATRPSGEVAFLWQNGVIKTVGSELSATGVNSSALVVGTAGDANGTNAAAWKDGRQLVLGRGSASLVNESGQVLGQGPLKNGTTPLVRWSTSGCF